MKKTILAIIVLAFCAGCGPSKSKLTLKLDSVKRSDSLAKHNTLAGDEAYSKLSCDSLMILLIKSTPIDQLILSDRPGIDSIKDKVVYLSFSHLNKENNTQHNVYYLEVDLKKKELRHVTEKPEELTFDKGLLEYIIEKKCYESDADNVNPTH